MMHIIIVYILYNVMILVVLTCDMCVTCMSSSVLALQLASLA